MNFLNAKEAIWWHVLHWIFSETNDCHSVTTVRNDTMTVFACCKNSVQYVPPDGLFGIQIAQNSISAGALPGPRWGSLRRSPDPIVGCGGGYPSSFPTHSTPLESRCRCKASRLGAKGTEIPLFLKRCCAPLFNHLLHRSLNHYN